MSIIGHSEILHYFEKAITAGTVSHAYLFIGPEHVGKTTVARWLTEKVLRISDPEFWNKPNPDIHWLTVAEDKKEITIEQVRKLRSAVHQSPFLLTHKVVILEQASSLSHAAANALLKTLEEPPSTSIFILVAHRIDTLPETIASRCQVVYFRRVSDNLIAEALEKKGVADYENKARMALGLPGRAIEWSDDSDAYEETLSSVNAFINILEKDIVSKFSFVEELLPRQTSLITQASLARNAVKTWQLVLRDMLLLKAELSDIITNDSSKNALKRIISKTEYATLNIWHRELMRSEKLLQSNVNPKLALENLMLQLTF